MSEWKTIESARIDHLVAPWDGRPVLISGVSEAHGPWVDCAYYNLAPRAVGADRFHPWTTLDETNGTNGRTMDGRYGPTHWMPLPEPPTREGG